MAVRAKFQVFSVTSYEKQRFDEKIQRSVPDGVSIEVKAHAVSGATNRKWANASPSGDFRIVINNEAAQPFFTPGKFFYMDLSEAPADDPAADS